MAILDGFGDRATQVYCRTPCDIGLCSGTVSIYPRGWMCALGHLALSLELIATGGCEGVVAIFFSDFTIPVAQKASWCLVLERAYYCLM